MSTPPAPPTLTAWEHAALLVGGVGAIAAGILDLTLSHAFGTSVDGALITGGLAVLGVKGVGLLPS